MDGSKRTVRGCKERKEMQKERTGLFVCFGFYRNPRGKENREGVRGLDKEKRS